MSGGQNPFQRDLKMGCWDILQGARRWQTLIIAVLVPVLAAPLPIFIEGTAAKCGYSLIIISFYWVTEIIPLAVTALLPIVLFPLFGIMPVTDVSAVYFTETGMLVFGSLVVAVAVEKWNLHKRLALRTLTLVGPQPRWLLLGVILPTWFLSMWMSNTATTAMMMPIVSGILLQIKTCQESDIEQNESCIDDHELTISEGSDQSFGIAYKSPSSSHKSRHAIGGRSQFLFFAKSFSLATAYSANIGGMATLTGTSSNSILKGIADGVFKRAGADNPINFASWLALGLPTSVILVTLLWVWMQIYMEGIGCLRVWKKDRTNYESVRAVLRQEYNSLGRMSYAEKSVSVSFLIMALLWITRKPGFIPGWGDLFDQKYVGDSIPAILVSIILFILPAHSPWQTCFESGSVSQGDDEHVKRKRKPYVKLLDWNTVNERCAWNVLILIGGGFALANGCEKSGLSAWVSSNLNGMSWMPTWTVTALLSITVALVTEVTSNAATTTLFVPIVGQTAISMGVNPLTFMIAVTVASCLAFMLPAATPPNALVFSSGYLKISDMVLAGLPMNTISLVVVNLMMNFWAVTVYDLDVLEEGFKVAAQNVTYFITSTDVPTVTTTLP